MNSHNYLIKHSQELSERYPGKYLALVEDVVVAVSTSGHAAFLEAKIKFPDKLIHISYMPTDEETVTLL